MQDFKIKKWALYNKNMKDLKENLKDHFKSL